MKKDIIPPIVEDIAIAIVQENDSPLAETLKSEEEWNVYIINLKKDKIHNILVTSRGYGLLNGEERKTSTLRHYVEELPPNSYAIIEPIMQEVFPLSNEFWVSFYIDKTIFDKKFVFVPETISKDYMINIPLVNKKGIMIK
ncbi:MAG: hypothetical protein ACK4IK_01000 [Bacteroidia bacterium]